MDIMNREELTEFHNRCRVAGHTERGIKGRPPKGMKYSDGSLIKNDVNVGFEDTVTGEIIQIKYGFLQ